MEMDIVYVLGKDYANSFNEFRYSVRSAEKNLVFDNLYILGVKPTFINDKAIHIPIADNLGHKYDNVDYRDWETDRKSTRLNSSHSAKSRMPSSA